MATGLAATSRRIASALTVILIVALTGPPAYAAAGTVTTSAQGLRGNVALLSLINVLLSTTQANWTTGGSPQTRDTASVGVPNVLNLGAVTASAGPSAAGGTAAASVAGLNLLGAVAAHAVSTQ